LRHLSVQDGLSQGGIRALLQDDEGFMWVGTENGLNMYDGYNFRLLPGPDGSFKENGIYKLYQDKQGLIWINASHGLYTYNKNTDAYQLILKHGVENKDDFVVDVIEGEQGIFWIATSKTLVQYNSQSQKIKVVLSLAKQLQGPNYINQIIQYKEVIVIATRAGSFALNVATLQWKRLPDIVQRDKKLSVNKEINENKVFNIHVSKESVLYLGTYQGLYSVNIGNIDEFITNKGSLPSYQVIDKEMSSWFFYPYQEKLYIGSQHGLAFVDLNNQKVERLFGFNDVFDNINKNIITKIIVDRQGVFWLGSYVTGIYTWDPQLELVTNYRYKKHDNNSLTDNVIWAIESSKTDDNQLWVSTENGINLVDLHNKTTTPYLFNTVSKSIYTESYVTALFEDPQQRLWLSTPKGIKLFDIKTKQLVNLPFSDEVKELLKVEHYSVFLDKDDYLWLMSFNQFKRININTGEIDEMRELEKVVKDEKAYNILGYLPNSSEMLLSTIDSLVSFNVKSKVTKILYTHPGILESDYSYIDSWVIDKNNILWLAFPTQGLVGLDAKTYQKKYFFNKQNSAIDHNLYGMNSDSDGDLWFSSHNGVYTFDINTHHLRNFNVVDGFGAREFNANAAEKLSDGRLAYGSINGFSLFEPKELKRKNQDNVIKVRTTNLNILSREMHLPFILNENEAIELAYDDVGIRIDFSALTFKNDNVLFNYQLTGKKNITFPETRDNYITFPSLPSGKYILKAKVKSPYSGEYSTIKTLTINVSYAPWASPIAYFLYAIIIFSLLWSWWRRKQLHTQALINAHEQVKYREHRLKLALKGSNSEVWDWQAKDNLMFACRASMELGFKNLTASYSFEQHLELIHEADREAFMHQWQTFIDTADLDDNFSCSYRLRTTEGEWLWYKDLGKIVAVDRYGIPTRITGSYTNITESRAHSERAQYYGDAFKQTKDWVLIISDNFTRVMVNQSLQDVFGWREAELSFDADIFGLNEQRRKFYKKLFTSLSEGEHWRGEELVQTKDGEEYHVLLNINVSRNTTTNSLHYVCIFTDITAQKTAENELRYLANYDHLTDLPNRSLLLERIKHAMASSQRASHSMALFFIDLDRFKQINDTLGHDCGDLLLQEVTARLKLVLRVDDTVARLGGDEFVILLETFKGNSQLGKVAQKIIDVIGQPVELHGSQVSVGASIGIALYPEDARNSDELLKNADVAMYHAKQIGRNTFQFFTPRMNIEASERLHAESKIKTAHEKDKFVNHYQPVVDSSIGKAIGVELLLRWQEDDRLIMPGEFIAIAEELGLIIEMTEKALQRGFRDLNVWRKHRPEMFLSVNIAAQHFAQDNFLTYLTAMLEEFNLPPNALKLEVTENTLIKNPEKVITKMRLLAKLGVNLALDDFGTGYSSLNYLKNLPLDVLKIDRSFVAGIGRDSADEAIVDATLVLANNLCMNCIAEGVETVEQLEYLAERNCYYVQGFLYSKAVDVEQISQYLVDDTIAVTI